jgi:hypothetical protein
MAISPINFARLPAGDPGVVPPHTPHRAGETLARAGLASPSEKTGWVIFRLSKAGPLFFCGFRGAGPLGVRATPFPWSEDEDLAQVFEDRFAAMEAIGAHKWQTKRKGEENL